MKRTLALFFVISLISIFSGCPNKASKSFDQCRIKGLTLINAEPDKELNGKIIKEYSPVPEKITLRLGELPTRRVMFLMNFAPEECAASIDGTVEFAPGNKSGLSKPAKPFVLLGFARTDILGNVSYTAGEMEPGSSNYELIPRFLKGGKKEDGEKLRLELEVIH